jgi:hypothetical protein
VKIFVMPCIAAGDTRRILGIGSADGGTERRSGTGGKESAANNIGIGLTVQRSDRHVGMLPAS